MSQGTVMEIMRSTYERGGLLGFFSGNDAGDIASLPFSHLCRYRDHLVSLCATALAVLRCDHPYEP